MHNVLIGSLNQLHEPMINGRRSKLTDDDLDSINSNYDYLVSLLQKKYGCAVLTSPKTKSTSDLRNSIGKIGH